MSLWRLTKYEQVLNREWTLIALLPDYEKGEKTPFEACILVSEDGCEADEAAKRAWLSCVCRDGSGSIRRRKSC